MEYEAHYEINCGGPYGFDVKPHGFDVKYSHLVNLTEQITAENNEGALRHALSQAKKFADNYLSDPETGFTTVKLLSLYSEDGDVEFDREKAVVKRSMEEHLLAALDSEESVPEE